MVKIIHQNANGTQDILDIPAGLSLMEGAVKANIAGIDADCGGACACATCHVYIDNAWMDKIPAGKPAEEDMLDFAFNVQPNSRLCCQIQITDSMEGLVFSVPEQD